MNNADVTETNNLTETTVAEPTSFGNGISDDMFSAGNEAAEAGSENQEGKDANKTAKQAPELGATAPAQGTTQSPDNKEQPVEVKGKLPPHVVKYLRDKGFWTEKDAEPNWENWHKSSIEAERFGTEARQSIATFKNQLSSIQTEKEEKQPINREELENSFREGMSNLRTVQNVMTAFINGTATEADRQKLEEWIQSEASELKKNYDKNLQELHDIEFAQKHGLVPKGDNSMESPEAALQKANTNVLSILKPEEQNTEQVKKYLGNPTTLNIIHRLAAVMFPREYNKGNTPEEVGRNNQTAINRVLASDPELAKDLVSAGKNAVKAEQFEAKLKEHGEAMYSKGVEDGQRGFKAQRPSSSPSPVKVVAPNLSDRAKQLDGLMGEDSWG